MPTHPELRSHPPSPDLAASARAVLTHLRARTGLDLWLVCRATDDRMIVLDALDHAAHGVRAGRRMPRSESLCAHMLQGGRPLCVPDLAATGVSTPLALRTGAAAYLGAPIHLPDGALFGTLCGADRRPQPSTLAEVLPEVELLARLLGVIASRERQQARDARRAERTGREWAADPITGVADRRAWQRALHAEDHRCRRSDTPAAVAVVALEGLRRPDAETLLRRTAARLRAGARAEDLVARLGDDAFGVLAMERAPEALAQALRATLARADIPASVAAAERGPGTGLAEAWRTAGAAVRDAQRSRRQGRVSVGDGARREPWPART